MAAKMLVGGSIRAIILRCQWQLVTISHVPLTKIQKGATLQQKRKAKYYDQEDLNC